MMTNTCVANAIQRLLESQIYAEEFKIRVVIS
jgi:hypothetical protein